MRFGFKGVKQHQVNMRKSALRFLIITCLLKLALFSHVYIHKMRIWSEAREHCRQEYTEMSSVFCSRENSELLNVTGDGDLRRPNVWIGLHKDDTDTWMWSDGRPASFFEWGKPNAIADSDICVIQTKRGWQNESCSRKLASYCFKMEAVLVKENKTWEEALEYCRDRQSDLVSLMFEAAQEEVLKMSHDSQTARVWTGLRYLADRWLWVDGEKMMYQALRGGEMPLCPALRRRCGALLLKEGRWESWDCTERLNFVCYKFDGGN